MADEAVIDIAVASKDRQQSCPNIFCSPPFEEG